MNCSGKNNKNKTIRSKKLAVLQEHGQQLPLTHHKLMFVQFPSRVSTEELPDVLFLSSTNKDVQSGRRETVSQIPASWIDIPFCGLISSVSTAADRRV